MHNTKIRLACKRWHQDERGATDGSQLKRPVQDNVHLAHDTVQPSRCLSRRFVLFDGNMFHIGPAIPLSPGFVFFLVVQLLFCTKIYADSPYNTPKECHAATVNGTKTAQVYICSIVELKQYRKHNMDITIKDNETYMVFYTFSGHVEGMEIDTIMNNTEKFGSIHTKVEFQASWDRLFLFWTLPYKQLNAEFNLTKQYLVNPNADMECNECRVQVMISANRAPGDSKPIKFLFRPKIRSSLSFRFDIKIEPLIVPPFEQETAIVDLNEMKLEQLHIKLDEMLDDDNPVSVCSAVVIRKVAQTSIMDTFWETSPDVVHLTYLRKADLILKKSMSPSGRFYLQFVTLSNDELCGITSDRSFADSAHSKKIGVVLYDASSKSYFLPIVFLVLVSIGPLVYANLHLIYNLVRKVVSRGAAGQGQLSIAESQEQSGDAQDATDDDDAQPQLPGPSNISTQATLHTPAPQSLIQFSEAGSSDVLVDHAVLQAGVVCESVDLETVHSISAPTEASVDTDSTCIFEHIGLDHKGLRLNTVDGLDENGHGFTWLTLLVSFFLIPAIAQLVSTYYLWRSETGDGDLCYHNFRCANAYGSLRAFNNIISNLPYPVAGISFIMFSYTKHKNHPSGLGSSTHFGIDVSIGMSTVFLGVFSAMYHVCPSSIFFHFDTAFMHLLFILCMFKLFALRHRLSNPHAAFFLTSLLIIFGAVATAGSRWTWLVLAAFHLVCLPFVCLQIYYNGHVDWDMHAAKSAWNSFRHVVLDEIRHRHYTPLFTHRLVILIVWNVLSFLVSILVNSVEEVHMSMYLLAVLLTDLFIYFVYYVFNKVQSKERIRKQCWFFMVLTVLFWGAALVCFRMPTTDWSKSASVSRSLNSDCVLFHFFDYHDVWHILSAYALFTSFIVISTVDDDVKRTVRPKLPIF